MQIFIYNFPIWSVGKLTRNLSLYSMNYSNFLFLDKIIVLSCARHKICLRIDFFDCAAAIRKNIFLIIT